MLAATRARAKTFLRKAFRVNGERFSEEAEAKMDALADRIIVVGKWSIRIFIVATIYLLIFGDSRLIEDAPLMWRIEYEWKHLLNQILYHIVSDDSALHHFKYWHRSW